MEFFSLPFSPLPTNVAHISFFPYSAYHSTQESEKEEIRKDSLQSWLNLAYVLKNFALE